MVFKNYIFSINGVKNMSSPKLKKFKDFVGKNKKSVDNFVPPILITADPVHGKHAKQTVEEALSWAGSKPGPATTRVKDWAYKNHNDHVGHNNDEVANIMSSHYAHDHKDIHHVKAYTTVSFVTNHYLNSVAHGHPSLTPGTEEHAKHTSRIAGIDRVLKSKTLDHDLHVFHGTNQWNPGKEAAKHPEGHVKVPSYMSTASSPTWAHTFARGYDNGEDGKNVQHVLHIHAKRGQHGMYIGTNRKQGNESEFLMPRNQTLKVHPKPEVLHDGTHVWKAHVIHQEDHT